MTETTPLLKSMIAHYKETGSRVDEVLFQEVMKMVEQVQVLVMKYENTGSVFNNSHQIKRIESAEGVLEFYAAAPTYEIQPDGKGGMYVDIEEDKGYRARMHLRRESRASGKNKDTTGN